MNSWLHTVPKEERRKEKNLGIQREMRDSGHEKTLPRVKYCFVLYKSLSDVNKTAVQREDGKMTQAEQKKELRKQIEGQNHTISELVNTSETDRDLMNVSENIQRILQVPRQKNQIPYKKRKNSPLQLHSMPEKKKKKNIVHCFQSSKGQKIWLGASYPSNYYSGKKTGVSKLERT